MFGANNPLKLRAKFNATTKSSGFEVYTWFYVINKLKTGDSLSKNTTEKLQILQIGDKNIDAINSKKLGMVDNIIDGYKDTF